MLGAPGTGGGGIPGGGMPQKPMPTAPAMHKPTPPVVVPPDAPIMRGATVILPRTLTGGRFVMLYPNDPGYDLWLTWIANNKHKTYFQSGADPFTSPYPGR